MGYCVLEKIQDLDTWEDIVKVSDPFLEYMSTKFLDGDFSFLAEVDDLKKVVDRLQAELIKVSEERRPAMDALAAAVNEMTELYKMIEDRDKFENLLKSETVFNDVQKSLIMIEWEKQRISGIKIVKCLGSETIEECLKHRIGGTIVVKCLGSETIEECLKRKSVKVFEATAKAQLLEPRMRLISESLYRAADVKHWIQIYTDAYGFSPPSSPSPPPSPTNTRVRDNIGSSSSPTNKEG